MHRPCYRSLWVVILYANALNKSEIGYALLLCLNIPFISLDIWDKKYMKWYAVWAVCAAQLYMNCKIFIIDPNSNVIHKITDMINQMMHI